MESDVRFPWEDPDDTTRPAPQAPADANAPLAGAPHTEIDADAPTDPAADPWSESSPDVADAGQDEQPWAAHASTDEVPVLERETPAGRDRPIAPKEYYSISEVCDLVDLKPHVLRYWETQFAVLNPSKNRSGNRVYQRKEIKLIQLVKNLLYDEKYTVEGAKQKLEQLRRGGELQASTARALDGQTIDMLRTELRRLGELLTPPEPA